MIFTPFPHEETEPPEAPRKMVRRWMWWSRMEPRTPEAHPAPLTPLLSLPGIADSQFAPLQNNWAGRMSFWPFPAQIFMILPEEEVSLLSEQVL